MASNSKAPDCPGDDVTLAYLGDRLSEEQATRFEEHYFHCDTCWLELERALEIRAASDEPSAPGVRAAPAASPFTRHRHRLSLAAAAAVAAVAVGWWLWPTPPPPGETLRGEPAAIELRMELQDEHVVAAWSRVRGADVYRVEAFSPEGELLLGWETVETTLSIDRQEVPGDPEVSFWRVQALDGLRQEVASSRLVELAFRNGGRR